jgi:hypothetical protein
MASRVGKVNLSDWCLDAVDVLRAEVEAGVRTLPANIVTPERCPRCGGAVRRESGLHAICEACGLPHASLDEAWASMSPVPPNVVLELAMNALWTATKAERDVHEQTDGQEGQEGAIAAVVP